MYKKFAVLILACALLALPATAQAQDDAPILTLSLHRIFGYGGLGGTIQGNISLRASGPDTLRSVRFYIDGELAGEDQEAPFRIQFNTDNFEPGTHQITAVGALENGEEITSNQITSRFLSGEQAFKSITAILIPVLLVSFLVSALPLISGKGKGKRPSGEYGPAGAAVCGRCQLPFSRRLFSINLAGRKLERCPHCGKVGLVRRASAGETAEAETRLRADHNEGGLKPVQAGPERLRRQLEDSKFEDQG